MIKIVLISFFMFVKVSAFSYEEFIKETLSQNAKFKASEINIKQIEQKVQTLTRFENPQLDLGVSKFKDENGYFVNLSQDIPMPSFVNRLRKLAKLKVEKANTKHKLLRAHIIKGISFKYVDYIQKTALYNLAKEETKIAKRIYEISKARFEAGSISKSSFLQAKLSYRQSEQNEQMLLLEKIKNYYDLLFESKITHEIDLDTNYKFLAANKSGINPEIALYELNKRIASIKSKTDTKILKSFSLNGEYEKEPEQNIYRVGISMPLALLNQKSQEKEIAKLEIQKERYLLSQLKKRVTLQLNKIEKENALLKKMQKNVKNLLRQEHSMLKIFQEGYKIANINLLQLQDLKNRLIQTKKQKIEIEMKFYKNNILKNYLTGVYNE